MPSYVTAKINTEYIFYISLVSQADTKLLQSNPTIAAGDFKVSINGAALNNPATLPAVTPASSKMVKVTLSTSEMNGDNITLVCSDAAGAEWCDLVMNIQTTASQIDDLVLTSNLGIPKNTTYNNFMFFMRDTTDHVTGKTGLTVVEERKIDGGSFAPCANAFSEDAYGMYRINLAASDLNGDVITFRFSGTGADDTFLTVHTR